MKHYIIESWLKKKLIEADTPAAAGQPDPSAGQAPMTDPNAGLGNIGNPMGGDPNIANPPMPDMTGQVAPPDTSQDPGSPEMPDQGEEQDFEVWKNKYFKESINGDANKLMDILGEVRDEEGLQEYQKKFVDDNWNIQLIRQNANIDKASKEIRKLIKDQLDRNNPSTSVVNHMTASLEMAPMLNHIFIKVGGYRGQKGDLHRKYVGALIGGVQVGSGANTEDLIFNERDYSIMLSTRFNSQWGDVMLGSWSLQEDDAQRYLSDSELKRLQEGSPEERDVLRRRVVIESIAKQFETRAFLINVVGENGTLYYFGWDISNSLKSAYADGKLIVKTRVSDNSEAMIDDDGQIVPLIDLSIYYVKDTGAQTDEGTPEKEEIDFLERRKGMLFLTATMQTIKEAAAAMPGSIFKEVPYQGNPSDLKTLQRCVYSAHDLIMRQC